MVSRKIFRNVLSFSILKKEGEMKYKELYILGHFIAYPLNKLQYLINFKEVQSLFLVKKTPIKMPLIG